MGRMKSLFISGGSEGDLVRIWDEIGTYSPRQFGQDLKKEKVHST